MNDEITRLKEEVERKDTALKKAETGLAAGVKQYASHDAFGNIIPGDEQYPWIKKMLIGLDAARAALTPSQERHLSLNEQAVMHSALRQSVTKEPRT
jgi:hypothetical protein